MTTTTGRAGGLVITVEDFTARNHDLMLAEVERRALEVMKQRLDREAMDLTAAWPKPPGPFVSLPNGRGSYYPSQLKRTGKSSRSFEVTFQRDAGLVYVALTNNALDPQGEAYTYHVNTRDFNYGNRKGKKTKAWQWYRARFRRVMPKIIAEEVAAILPKEI